MLSQEDWLMIRELYDHGMSISEISRRLNIDRKTARKYAKSNEIPRYPKRNKKQSKIDPYVNEIKDMINTYVNFQAGFFQSTLLPSPLYFYRRY
ncbi:MAG: helix-turn-helix domain-containing protein [Thermoplasmata archaeon]